MLYKADAFARYAAFLFFIKDISNKNSFLKGGEKMDIYINNLEKMLDELKHLKSEYDKELSHSPQGSLHRIVRTTEADKGVIVTYIWAVKTEEGKILRRGVTKDTVFIRRMARKAYLKKALRIIERDIEVVERAVRRFRPLSSNDIMDNITSPYRGLPAEYFLDTEIVENDSESLKCKEGSCLPKVQ